MQIVCLDFYGKEHKVDSDYLIDRSSAYGVYANANGVLLIQDPRSLRWELPGGGIEEDETSEGALIREFMEESGLIPYEDLKFLTEWEELYYDVTSEQGWRSKRKFYLISSVEDENTIFLAGNGDDSARAEFIPLSEIEVLNMHPKIKNVIKQACN